MITIVTAFFDIGRGNWDGTVNGCQIPAYIKRTNADYFEYFGHLAKINNPMVIHTSSVFKDRVLKLREGKKTEVVIHDELFTTWGPLLKQIQAVMDDSKFIAAIRSPNMPEYWNAYYVLVNFLKAHFVTASSVVTQHAAWIDFGYCRDANRFPTDDFTWERDFGDRINLFYIRQPEPERPLHSIVASGDVYIQGCHIVAPTNMWSDLFQLMSASIDDLLAMGMIDDDQTLLLMSYFRHPEMFKLNAVNSSDWFVIFKQATK